MTITYPYGTALYINLTNACPCDCVFCVRRFGAGLTDGQNLWLENNPGFEALKAELTGRNLDDYSEIVFCGYGEPTMRLEILLQTAAELKARTARPVRLNTNGLSDLIHGRPTARSLAENIDRVSISLNAPDANKYTELCAPIFGAPAFDALINFATECKSLFQETVMSVVGAVLNKEELAACQALCGGLGLELRVR